MTYGWVGAELDCLFCQQGEKIVETCFISNSALSMLPHWTQPISDQVLGISAKRVCGSARLLVGLLVHRVPLLDREGPF